MLCILSLIFHFLVRRDIDVDTDVSRYIENHRLFRIPIKDGTSFLNSFSSADVLPVSIRSTIFGPRISMYRGLRGVVDSTSSSSVLQRISTTIVSSKQHDEEQNHEIKAGKIIHKPSPENQRNGDNAKIDSVIPGFRNGAVH